MAHRSTWFTALKNGWISMAMLVITRWIYCIYIYIYIYIYKGEYDCIMSYPVVTKCTPPRLGGNKLQENLSFSLWQFKLLPMEAIAHILDKTRSFFVFCACLWKIYVRGCRKHALLKMFPSTKSRYFAMCVYIYIYINLSICVFIYI